MPTAAYADGGGGVEGGFTVVDDTPPAAVTDLAVISRSDTSLTLTWTAPGDDGLSGTASQYDIRYSTSAIDTEAAWEAATVVSAPPTPQAAASVETFTVTGLSSGTRYYLALKTADGVPNWSGLSDSPLGITSEPAIVISYAPEGSDFAGQTSLWDKINRRGVITQSVAPESFDGLLTLKLNKGTTALTRYGTPLSWIGMYEVGGTPSPPRTAYIVSLMYDLRPCGATFDPPATLTCTYDPGHLPEDFDEEELVIASYDEGIGEWANLDCVVDTEAKTITAKISHFSPLAAFAYKVTLSPAIFEYSALDISPSRISIGEAVTIRLLAANTGDETGSSVVTLKMDGKVEATENVTLAAGTSKPISFTTIRNTPGTYFVAVNGVTGSFTVEEGPVPTTLPPAEMPPAGGIPSAAIPINWPVLWGVVIGGGVVILALVIRSLVKRRGLEIF